MLDIKLIRQNPDAIKAGMAKRNKNFDAIIDEIISLDEQRRSLSTQGDQLKAQQNEASKLIPAYRKEGKDTNALMAQMKEISDQAKVISQKLMQVEAAQQELAMGIPNVPHETVPTGADSEENTEVRRSGEPCQFPYQPRAHWEIGERLEILDPARAAKVTGARFHFYKGLGARLERSIINFFLDTHTAAGYTEILPPFIANRASMTGTGQLPKFEEDMFKLEGLDYFLVPTAEVPVTNYHRDEIIEGATLPYCYCAYSACFRAEAGSAGRDTRGLIRQHQFNKVELVKFCKPENSYKELESLTNNAAAVLEALGLPYRIVTLCGGDLGFSSAKTYDIEVWMPSYNRYVEISSCSNFEDFQARRAGIRYKDGPKDKAQLVHTLNGSGVAVGRTVAAILENFQNEDGSVSVPKVLQGYMGTDLIRP